VIEPMGLTEAQRIVWLEAMENADASYLLLRKMDCPPQVARHVLPIGVKTEIVITANLREWMHIFSLRCASAAHPHIRALFLQALQIFAERVPSMFKDLRDELAPKSPEE
jgi:thymidylate synthase (FAD)